MNLLHALDREARLFEWKLCEVERVRTLLNGSISRQDYAALLTAFYFIEHYSRLAVTGARNVLREADPYLSKRFGQCADGEQGHAEMALADLKAIGFGSPLPCSSPKLAEYGRLLRQASEQRPYAILGHSFLFESTSGSLFPRIEKVPYPSTFVHTHALEDPGHTLAIRRTVKTADRRIEEAQKAGLVAFARLSGSRFLELVPLFQA